MAKVETVECPKCDGKGGLQFGKYGKVWDCDKCHGTGRIPKGGRDDK